MQELEQTVTKSLSSAGAENDLAIIVEITEPTFVGMFIVWSLSEISKEVFLIDNIIKLPKVPTEQSH